MILQDDILRAARGHHDAFVRIIKACEPSMYRLAKSYLKSDSEIADALQETILKAFQSINTLREPQYFKTWLLRILINECNRMLKHRSQVIPIADMSDRGSYSHDPQHNGLNEAVQALEEELRIVVTLFYLEDLPLKEIASLLDLPEGTIKSRLFRAREKLSRYLRQERSMTNE